MEGIILDRRVRYAIIEATYNRARSQRFVVGYTTKKSLRELIAAERILALGFQSRNEASEFANCPELGATVSESRGPRWLCLESFVVRVAQAIVRQFAFVPACLEARYARPAIALARR